MGGSVEKGDLSTGTVCTKAWRKHDSYKKLNAEVPSSLHILAPATLHGHLCRPPGSSPHPLPGPVLDAWCIFAVVV